jgi:transposase
MLEQLDMTIPLSVLGLSNVTVEGIYLRNGCELVIKVASTEEETHCRKCGAICDKHGHDREMELRHLPILGYQTYIQISPKRGICKQCDDKPITTTQTLDWYDRKSRQTKPYEDYLLFSLVNGTVADISRKESIDEHTIAQILDKKIEAKVDFSSIKKLGVLGIDEISLRKGRQQYVSVLTYRVDHKVNILAVLEGRKKADILRFLKSIPPHLQRTVTAVCCDLYDGYIQAAKAVFADKVVTADRFHVAKLYRKKLVNIRKSELTKLKKRLSKDQYQSFKDAIAILRKGRDYFTDAEKEVVQKLFDYSPKLRLAYQFSRELTAIFDTHQNKDEAQTQLREWIERVTCSELTVFNGFIKTLCKYIDEISNYFISRNNSGFVEGFNNKIKSLTRRCYGLKSAKRLFQRLKLDTLGGSMFAFQPAM